MKGNLRLRNDLLNITSDVSHTNVTSKMKIKDQKGNKVSIVHKQKIALGLRECEKERRKGYLKKIKLVKA